jgi:hypothetical protein
MSPRPISMSAMTMQYFIILYVCNSLYIIRSLRVVEQYQDNSKTKKS